jgi:hypothetical protein
MTDWWKLPGLAVLKQINSATTRLRADQSPSSTSARLPQVL